MDVFAAYLGHDDVEGAGERPGEEQEQQNRLHTIAKHYHHK